METKEIAAALKEFCENIILGESFPINMLLFENAANRLEELESEIVELKQQLSENPKWISVEDRLPEEDGKFLTFDEFGNYYVELFDMAKGWELSDEDEDLVTHWMPLPEPPKPKEPTFKDVFLKAFPKTKIEEGIPKACVEDIFPWVKYPHCNGRNCDKCWNQPYFETEEEGEGE